MRIPLAQLDPRTLAAGNYLLTVGTDGFVTVVSAPILLEYGQDATDVPANTTVGTLIFRKATP